MLGAALAGARAEPRQALCGAGLFALLPALVLARLAAPARLSDLYDPPPALRQRMLLAGTACYGTGLVASLLLDMGPLVAWVGATFLAGAAAVLVIDRVWKISIHNTGAGGGAMLLSGLFAPPFCLLCWSLPVVVGWARWRRGAHSRAQLVAGAALGAIVAWALRGLAT